MSDYAVPVLASLNLSQTWKFYRYFGFELVGPSQDDLGGEAGFVGIDLVIQIH